MLHETLKNTIRAVPDFPKPGIVFRDITPVLHNPELCNELVNDICVRYQNGAVDAVAGIESRGFLFGFRIAQQLGVPFILIRKKGKLPAETLSYAYDLEYGSAEIEMHKDAVVPGLRVLIHDDLLATGGTAKAAAELVKIAGGEVAGFNFLIELSELKGVEGLKPYSQNIFNLVAF